MSKEQLQTEYNSKAIIFEALKEEALFIIRTDLSKNNIKTHSILSRIKDFESFCDKIERKQIKEPFNEIKDILGLRVVCLFLSDIKNIGSLIKSSFQVLEEDNKIDGFDEPSSFGYMSLHFIVKMKSDYKGPRYDKIRDIPFEIQVRTITMDAWANISHYLSYKTDTDIPKDLKRDFNALSGLFYVADTHFELFFKQSKESQKNIQSRVESSLEGKNDTVINEEINFDSLKAYLSSKFPDRKHSDGKVISTLIKEMNSVGITSINQLEEMYNLAWDVFVSYEQENPPHGEGKYYDVGIIRGLLGLTNKKYREDYSRDIDREFLERIDNKKK